MSVCLSLCQLLGDMLGFLLGWHRQKAVEGGIWIKDPWFFLACVTPADISNHCCWECIFQFGVFLILSHEVAHQSSQLCVSEKEMLGPEPFQCCSLSGMGWIVKRSRSRKVWWKAWSASLNTEMLTPIAVGIGNMLNSWAVIVLTERTKTSSSDQRL